MEGLEEEYDFFIIGTGLPETALSQILSVKQGYKILHIDTDTAYGSEFSTLRYSQLEKHFGAKPEEMLAALLEKDREFNIDLTPKLLLQDSKLKEFLVEHQIHELATFTAIKESYFYSDRLHSIPRSESQSLRSSAISFRQKFNVIRFFYNVKSMFNKESLPSTGTMREEFARFGLNEDSCDFIGHAICLNLDDSYLDEPPNKTYDRIVRYVSSIVGYADTESPYIYPHYGLSELCQAFARRSASNGTTFMLGAKFKIMENQQIKITDPNGMEHQVKAKKIIADPRYINKTNPIKRIIRCILILKKGKRESRSIIFLKKNLGRKNDVFCVILGASEMACPPEYEIAVLSTVQEGKDPKKEMEPILEKFDAIKEFIEVRECYREEDTDWMVFTSSVDESALMENIYDDINKVLIKLKIQDRDNNNYKRV